MSEQPQNTEVHIDENKLIAERKQKLAELREAGQAFPNDFRRDAYCTDLQNRFGSMENDVLEADKQFFSARLVSLLFKI